MDNRYGANRSPLRSPLRPINGASGAQRSGNSQNRMISQRDEEELYNRRRQEELRMLSQNTQQYLQPQLRPQSANITPQQNQRTSTREQPPPTSHFTLGQQASQHTPPPQQLIPMHIREHISQLQNDNASLMRRLNLVHQELERINKEKGELQGQLTSWMKQSTEFYDILNSEDNVDRVNKYMKDDLTYERERNQKLKLQIQELNTQILNMADEVKQMGRDQELMIRTNQESQYVLQKQIAQISDLEKEQFFNQERIKESHTQIDASRIECSDLDAHKYSLRQAIELVMAERNDLIDRVTELSHRFDETVRQVTEERQVMETSNSRHAKFVTAKIIFNELHQMHQRKLLQGFQEIVTYTNFDSKCNLKLKTLAKLLEKAGQTKLKCSLNHWFSCALKPTEAKEQSLLVSADCGRTKLTSKFYRLWKDLYDERIRQYEQKTRAVQLIWKRFFEEARHEKQRSFDIWKAQFSRFKLIKFRLRRLLAQKIYKASSIALSAWKNNDSYFDSQIRLGLLAQNFTHKQYLATLFHSFHRNSQNLKRKRLSVLAHNIKAWKDFLANQKYLMSQNLLATNFQTEAFTSVIKGCFDSWKQYKQAQMYKKTYQTLHGDELKRIEELTDGNRYMMRERRLLNVARGCEAIKIKLQKRVWSYINHWRMINVDYHDKLRTTLKDKVIKLCWSHERVAFHRWKRMHDNNKYIERRHVNRDLQTEQVDLQNEVISVTNSNNDKQDDLTYQRHRHLLKCVEGYETRFLSLSIGRWRDAVTSMNEKEQGAYKIMRRLRLRLLRKCIDLYIAGIEFRKKTEKEEEKVAMYNKIREERLKGSVLNAWLNFKQKHLTAKDYWYRIFVRLDLTRKRLACKKWVEVTQMRVEKSLKGHENEIISTIEDLNHNIGELDQLEIDQQQGIDERKKLLMTQGQRILSNHLARFHSVNLVRGFERWREYIQFQKNRERLLEKATTHIKKSQFYGVKAAFRNWIQNANIEERRAQLKRENMKVNDTVFQTRLQEDLFVQKSNELINETEVTNSQSQLISQKLQNTIQLIVKRVNENHYTSQKRYIYEQWSNYVSREVYFINCIKSVLTKSMLNDGFQSIKELARDYQYSVVRQEVITKFFTFFQRRKTLNALSQWRNGNFNFSKQVTFDIIRETNDREERHQEWKDKIKTHNALRAEKIISTNLKKNSLKAWQNVAHYLKVTREKDLLCKAEINSSNQRNAIIKWRARYQLTKERRASIQLLNIKFNQMRLKTYFEGMRNSYFKQKELIVRLANLSTILDHQQLQQSFASIKSYSRAKSFAYEKRKQDSSQWFALALESLFKKKKQSYLTYLRIRAINKRKVDTLKRLTVSLNLGKSLRNYFQLWREQSNKESLAKELYEGGSVRLEDASYKSELRNIRNLLEKEGYDESEINQAKNQQLSRQQGLIMKSIRRLQHYNEANYVKPKMFDRWKAFLHAKKQFRYWLNFVDKRGDHIKCDLHQAFDRWKAYHPIQKHKLTIQNKAELNRKAVLNNKTLDKLAEDLQEKDSIIDHLNAQRETLLDNYIKAQKLVLSYWVNRHRNAMHTALMNWNDRAQKIRNIESSELLKRNLSTLEQLKQRIKHFETSNELIANENEELRQFSLDGYEIAKNVQALSAEREILSVDLADKAQVIKKLLDENDLLSRRLQEAQQHAQNLIRHTMRRERGGSREAMLARPVR